MLTKQCARCRKIIPYGTTYCMDCQPIAQEQAEQSKAKHTSKYNKQRDPKYKQFYMSREWLILRRLALQRDEYMCVRCKALGVMAVASEVHHIKPISIAWDKRLDIDNTECLCLDHHNAEHGRFKKRGR